LGATLEETIGDRLRESGGSLATAESCSGGLIAHRVTNVAGSSAYFFGGVVSYSNEAKVSLLGVSKEVLAEHGAVSEAVARQMAEGARSRFGAKYAVACTGIAGPTGGTPDKPVGLVFVGVAGPKGTRVERCQFQGDRARIKDQTADRALSLVLEALS
jgi:nicotinamide-nucleotide amidase